MNRIETFKQMLIAEPSNTMVLFGLANEYLKVEDYENAVPTLENYLSQADDEGAAFGMLAKAYEKIGARDKARIAYENGINAANKHGHPTMASDFQEILEFDYSE